MARTYAVFNTLFFLLLTIALCSLSRGSKFLLLASFVTLIILFFFLALSIAPRSTPASHTSPSLSYPPELPKIPRTSEEAFTQLTDAQFEIFSAAVVIGMGEGHRFLSHSGKSGDEGVDIRLCNLYSQRVIVQSKRYAADNHISQPTMRDFLGSIIYHRVAYGFFVTTSSCTAPAKRLVYGSHGRIRIIDSDALSRLLHYRYREIALAYQDVLDAISA